MTIQINYKNSTSKTTSGNLILFVNDKFEIKGFKKYISKSEQLYMSDLLKNSDFKKKLEIFELSSKKKIILVSIKKNIKISSIENLGAELYNQIQKSKKSEYIIHLDTLDLKNSNYILHFLHGLRLKHMNLINTTAKKNNSIKLLFV